MPPRAKSTSSDSPVNPQALVVTPMSKQAAIAIAAKHRAAIQIGVSYDEYNANIERGLKWCFLCGEWHDRSEFNPSRSRRDGLTPYCRASDRARIPTTFREIDGEEWRPVADYEGIYEVSSLARVKKILDEPGKKKAPFELKQSNSHGYRVVTLSQGGQAILARVHVLVCVAFHGLPPEDGMEPNHKDGNKSNNLPDNLEWTTHSGNMLHAYATGLKVPRKGEAHERAKLTEAQVREIRSLQGAISRSKLASRYRISKSVISQIQRGEIWKHLLGDEEASR